MAPMVTINTDWFRKFDAAWLARFYEPTVKLFKPVPKRKRRKKQTY